MIITANCCNLLVSDHDNVIICVCFSMFKIPILLSVLFAVIVCGKSVPLLKPMSHDMIDFINNKARTTWKVRT